MLSSDHTRLDDNTKRIDVGALVTLANVSTDEREHYYISAEQNEQPTLHAHAPVTVLAPDDQLAQILIGKMKGEKVFFRHDLLIEFIEWPASTKPRT